MAAKEGAVETSSAAAATTKPPAGPIIFVIGPPGAGKGTLCAHICERFPEHFRHLSVGGYLRELFSNDGEEASSPRPDSEDSETGCLPPDEIERYVQESRTLPPETIIPLIKAKMLGGDSSSTVGWLIEGFPRNVKTALAFEREVGVSQCPAPWAFEIGHADIQCAFPDQGTHGFDQTQLRPSYHS